MFIRTSLAGEERDGGLSTSLNESNIHHFPLESIAQKRSKWLQCRQTDYNEGLEVYMIEEPTYIWH